MSKITFRADADLVDRLEEFEASKSEVMREALRSYLDDAERRTAPEESGEAADECRSDLDDALAARVDELVTARLDEELGARRGRLAPGEARPFGMSSGAPAVNLTVNVDGAGGADVERSADPETAATPDATTERRPADAEPSDAAGSDGAAACAQCGEEVSDDHVYCPNCGEKTSRRLFCECGDELRSDWGFCPSCGRRTPAADVLEGR
ncbi:double zinc ribbon domain-containing protein [Halobaculum sp. EA56]|uniref:double zinc ribbon domain-containing protein n=1 Tax=Halobaculum sp. EA56 TaxID=3421648 RepID=UPI003EBC04FE